MVIALNRGIADCAVKKIPSISLVSSKSPGGDPPLTLLHERADTE